MGFMTGTKKLSIVTTKCKMTSNGSKYFLEIYGAGLFPVVDFFKLMMNNEMKMKSLGNILPGMKGVRSAS